MPDKPDEIDRIINDAYKSWRRNCFPTDSYPAQDIRYALKAAGFEIVPSTTALIEKGKDVVDGGKTHD